MQFGSHQTNVRKDIARWRESGLVDEATATRLLADVDGRDAHGPEFGSVLAMMAAVLFGAAILVFIAANWDAIPRLLRVAGLFAAIVGGYAGGALLKARGEAGLGEAAWLVASAAFGGAIALVGQMYHMAGDEGAALLTWCAGVSFAAVLLRSGPLTVGASLVAIAWMFMEGADVWGARDFPHLYIALAAGLWLVSLWTNSVASRHLLLASLSLYAALTLFESRLEWIRWALAIGSAALFALAATNPDTAERLARLEGRALLHCLVGFLGGLVLIQFGIIDDTPALALSWVVGASAIVAALILAGRRSRGLRWAAYAGFGFELCLIYVALLGTMLSTAGMFLASGVVLGIVALFIMRVERRMKSQPIAGSPA